MFYMDDCCMIEKHDHYSKMIGQSIDIVSLCSSLSMVYLVQLLSYPIQSLLLLFKLLIGASALLPDHFLLILNQMPFSARIHQPDHSSLGHRLVPSYACLNPLLWDVLETGVGLDGDETVEFSEFYLGTVGNLEEVGSSSEGSQRSGRLGVVADDAVRVLHFLEGKLVFITALGSGESGLLFCQYGCELATDWKEVSFYPLILDLAISLEAIEEVLNDCLSGPFQSLLGECGIREVLTCRGKRGSAMRCGVVKGPALCLFPLFSLGELVG